MINRTVRIKEICLNFELIIVVWEPVNTSFSIIQIEFNLMLNVSVPEVAVKNIASFRSFFMTKAALN